MVFTDNHYHSPETPLHPVTQQTNNQLTTSELEDLELQREIEELAKFDFAALFNSPVHIDTDSEMMKAYLTFDDDDEEEQPAEFQYTEYQHPAQYEPIYHEEAERHEYGQQQAMHPEIIIDQPITEEMLVDSEEPDFGALYASTVILFRNYRHEEPHVHSQTANASQQMLDPLPTYTTQHEAPVEEVVYKTITTQRSDKVLFGVRLYE